jgi:hypothetical protein
MGGKGGWSDYEHENNQNEFNQFAIPESFHMINGHPEPNMAADGNNP